MKQFDYILLKVFLLTVLTETSTSLKCADCTRTESRSLCNNEIDCPAGKVCYTIKRHRDIDVYVAGCGLKETYCGDHAIHRGHHHGVIHGALLRPHEEVQCCDTGDMCNMHLTFSTDNPTPTPYRLTTGIECQVCSGPTCGVNGDDPMVRCPDEFPYCMNVVLNEASGSKMVTKRCSKRSECQRKDNSTCAKFDPSEIYPNSIECIYCCETEGCNKDIVPRAETLITV